MGSPLNQLDVTNDLSSLEPEDREWAAALLKERWDGPLVERLGELVDASLLPGFVARQGAERAGLLTYEENEGGLEVVTLDSLSEGRGIGSALMLVAEHRARELGQRRAFLLTSNDNLKALGFCQRRGYRLVAVHRDAMVRARALKPGIPMVGLEGIPLWDEIELEKFA